MQIIFFSFFFFFFFFEVTGQMFILKQHSQAANTGRDRQSSLTILVTWLCATWSEMHCAYLSEASSAEAGSLVHIVLKLGMLIFCGSAICCMLCLNLLP